MLAPDNVLSLVTILVGFAWPVVVLLFVWAYRDEIRALLERIQTVKAPGGVEATFRTSKELTQRPSGEVPAEPTATQPAREEVSEADINWEYSANLYWLGYDLGSAVNRAALGAQEEGIVHSVRQSWWHAKQLGFTEPSITGKLKMLKDDAEAAPAWYWNRERRGEYIRELYSVSAEIERLAIEHQPRFRSTGEE